MECEIDIVPPRLGMKLAVMYVALFLSFMALAFYLWRCATILGRLVWLVLVVVFRVLDEYIVSSKMMGLLSAISAIVSGLFWFVSAITQRTLNNVGSTEELADVLAATMEWQVKGAIAAIVAAFFALAATVSAKSKY